MKLMPALPESIFDILYLSFAIVSGCQILKLANGQKGIRLMGVAALVLGCGDTFHLVPRVLDYWLKGDYTAALGIGKLVTSVTMTIFYLILEYVRMDRYKSEKGMIFTKIIWALAVLRIALCMFPQNAWTSSDAPTSWGIYRNIPFLAIGLITCVLWHRDAKRDSVFRFLYLAVFFS